MKTEPASGGVSHDAVVQIDGGGVGMLERVKPVDARGPGLQERGQEPELLQGGDSEGMDHLSREPRAHVLVQVDQEDHTAGLATLEGQGSGGSTPVHGRADHDDVHA